MLVTHITPEGRRLVEVGVGAAPGFSASGRQRPVRVRTGLAWGITGPVGRQC